LNLLLDTNILARYVIQSDPQHLEVRSALERVYSRQWDPVFAPQSIYEFWVVATRPLESNGLGLDPLLVRAEVQVILDTFPRLSEPLDLLETWLDLCARHSVKGRTAHDTRLVAVALAHGITHILTLDPRDFRRYPEISVLTPEDV